jgi:Putative MetA-pathway of phenol degradation
LKIKFIALALVGLFSTAVQAADEVTAYRPGVGAPAYLSATGRFELEVGFDRASAGGATATSLGGLLKYGLSDNIGLLFGVPYLNVKDSTGSVKGLGDSSIGLKWVQKANASVAYGVQAMATLPTGSSAFKADKSTITLTGLVGLDTAGFHTDFNVGLIRPGTSVAGIGKSRLAYSVGVTRALGGGFGAFVEASGSRQSGTDSTVTLLAAVTYTVDPNLVVDASVSRTKVAGEGVTAFGVGMSYLLPK